LFKFQVPHSAIANQQLNDPPTQNETLTVIAKVNELINALRR